MSYEIPLSVIRECYGIPTNLEDAGREVDDLKENKAALTLMHEDDQEFLTRAEKLDCVEWWNGEEWRCPLRTDFGMSGWRAYRLHPDCVVVDDTWVETVTGPECELDYREKERNMIQSAIATVGSTEYFANSVKEKDVPDVCDAMEKYLIGRGYIVEVGHWLNIDGGPCVTVYSPTEQVAVEPYSRKLYALACAVMFASKSECE